MRHHQVEVVDPVARRRYLGLQPGALHFDLSA
jgi:hypothetical protein